MSTGLKDVFFNPSKKKGGTKHGHGCLFVTLDLFFFLYEEGSIG